MDVQPVRGYCAMVSSVTLYWLLGGLVIGLVRGDPLPYQAEGLPLTLVSDLTSRLGAHPPRLQEARLPLPTPQDLEAIRKVAQILVTLGQQVIPAIIGEPQSSPAPGDAALAEDPPNDPVALDKQLISS